MSKDTIKERLTAVETKLDAQKETICEIRDLLKGYVDSSVEFKTKVIKQGTWIKVLKWGVGTIYTSILCVLAWVVKVSISK